MEQTARPACPPSLGVRCSGSGSGEGRAAVRRRGPGVGPGVAWVATLSTDVQGSRRAPHSPPWARQASWSPMIGTRFLSQRSPVRGASGSGCSLVEGVYPAKGGGRTPAVQGHLPLSVAPSGASEKPGPSCHQIQALLPHRQGPPEQRGSQGWASSEKMLANSFCPGTPERGAGSPGGRRARPASRRCRGASLGGRAVATVPTPQEQHVAPASAEPGVGWGGGLGPRGLGAAPSSPAHLGLSRAAPSADELDGDARGKAQPRAAAAACQLVGECLESSRGRAARSLC